MSGKSVFKVVDPGEPRRVADRPIGDIAERICDRARARTPVITGRLRAGWRVEHGREQAVRIIVNDVPYARFVEYGTKNMPAEPMLGPVVAEARTGML